MCSPLFISFDALQFYLYRSNVMFAQICSEGRVSLDMNSRKDKVIYNNLLILICTIVTVSLISHPRRSDPLLTLVER